MSFTDFILFVLFVLLTAGEREKSLSLTFDLSLLVTVLTGDMTESITEEERKRGREEEKKRRREVTLLSNFLLIQNLHLSDF